MDVTRKRVETSQGQQSPQYCSWLFPGLGLQGWVTCPADTKGCLLCTCGYLFQYPAAERLIEIL